MSATFGELTPGQKFIVVPTSNYTAAAPAFLFMKITPAPGSTKNCINTYTSAHSTVSDNTTVVPVSTGP